MSCRLYRRGAPETSIAAAVSIDTTHLEKIVLSVIRAFPDGAISDEVREVCEDEYGITAYSSVTARYKALHEKGAIQYVGKRKGLSGRSQRVMQATPTQLFLFDQLIGEIRP